MRPLLLLATALVLAGLSCDPAPWDMPCPEGWVMDADQECYDPAGDDDSADDDADDDTA